MAANVLTITDANFQAEVPDAEQLTLVDFWAEWCGPCRLIAPVVEQLATDYAGQVRVGKLDVDSNQRSATQFNVRSIPAILFFKGGQVVDTVVGALPRGPLEAKIKQHLAA